MTKCRRPEKFIVWKVSAHIDPTQINDGYEHETVRDQLQENYYLSKYICSILVGFKKYFGVVVVFFFYLSLSGFHPERLWQLGLDVIHSWIHSPATCTALSVAGLEHVPEVWLRRLASQFSTGPTHRGIQLYICTSIPVEEQIWCSEREYFKPNTWQCKPCGRYCSFSNNSGSNNDEVFVKHIQNITSFLFI